MHAGPLQQAGRPASPPKSGDEMDREISLLASFCRTTRPPRGRPCQSPCKVWRKHCSRKPEEDTAESPATEIFSYILGYFALPIKYTDTSIHMQNVPTYLRRLELFEIAAAVVPSPLDALCAHIYSRCYQNVRFMHVIDMLLLRDSPQGPDGGGVDRPMGMAT